MAEIISASFRPSVGSLGEEVASLRMKMRKEFNFHDIQGSSRRLQDRVVTLDSTDLNHSLVQADLDESIALSDRIQGLRERMRIEDEALENAFFSAERDIDYLDREKYSLTFSEMGDRISVLSERLEILGGKKPHHPEMRVGDLVSQSNEKLQQLIFFHDFPIMGELDRLSYEDNYYHYMKSLAQSISDGRGEDEWQALTKNQKLGVYLEAAKMEGKEDIAFGRAKFSALSGPKKAQCISRHLMRLEQLSQLARNAYFGKPVQGLTHSEKDRINQHLFATSGQTFATDPAAHLIAAAIMEHVQEQILL